jgi:glycosyltransferase involved in cell wall biosynthesis
MRVLLLHNYYQQAGGEDSVVQQEKLLLESKGHVVDLLTENNSSISGFKSKVATGFRTIYSTRSRARVKAEIAKFNPDVVHIHNLFPQFSPSVYYACKKARVPVVQTLHNFRLICPNAILFREGRPCEQCIGHFIPWPGIANACYRNSRSGTAAVAVMLATHRVLRTWNTCVDAYITLSEFARRKFVAGGLPSDRLFVKPNCLTPDPGARKNSSGFALFVGRLSAEKGLSALLTAWQQLQDRKLKIVGDGPLRGAVEEMRGSNVEFLGSKSSADVLELIGAAAFLVMPSECYENFPRVIVEAFSRGVPVLASRIGSAQELIRDGCTGIFFRPSDPNDLATKAEWLFSHSVDLERMSQGARSEFLAKYTGDQNYDRLMQIYGFASELSKKGDKSQRESHREYL